MNISKIILCIVLAGIPKSYGAAADDSDSEESEISGLVSLSPRARNEELLLTAYNSKLYRMQALLKMGAGVDTKGPLGYTSLSIASCCGNLAMAQLLLGYRADIETRDCLDKSTVLIKAAINGQNTMVQFLLHSNAQIDAQDKMGYTALMRAVEADKDPWRLSIGRVLLRNGADISLRNTEGKELLDIACDHNFFCLERYLAEEAQRKEMYKQTLRPQLKPVVIQKCGLNEQAIADIIMDYAAEVPVNWEIGNPV